MDLHELRKKPVADLEKIFQDGIRPDFERLVGFEFKGFNTPFIAKVIGIQKFKKGFFHRKEAGSKVRFGYNIPVRQNGPDAPWTCKPSDEKPKWFGFYRVRSGEEAGGRSPKKESLFLDYGSGGNPALDPSRFLRDFLVQVSPGNFDVYLGKAFIALGPAWVFPSFFVLERDRRSPVAS